MPTRFLAAILLSISIAAPALRGDDWVVDNVAGVDSLENQRSGRAFKTIQFALRVARPGDRIVLQKSDQPYREEISFTGAAASGFLQKPLTLVGNGATLEGAEPIPPERWEAVEDDVFRYLPRLISHQRLFIDHRPAKKVNSVPGFRADLQPLEWTQFEGWIYFRTEANKAPFQYDLSCCARTTGLTIYQARHIVIHDLVIQGFQLDGVNAYDLAENIQIHGCTLRGNGRSGVSNGGTSQVLLSGCLVGDNGHSQVRAEGVSKLTIENCDIIEQEGILPIDHQGGLIVKDGQSIRK
jgi:hypothetical protein